MANYIIKFSSTDNEPSDQLYGKSSFQIAQNDINDNSTALVLHGANSTSYGKDIWNNMILLLENFCNFHEPEYNTLGQLWFNSSKNRLEVYSKTNGTYGYTPVSPIEFTGSTYNIDKPLVSNDENNFINIASGDTDPYFVTSKYVHDNFLSARLLDNVYTFNKLLNYDTNITVTSFDAYPKALASKEYVDSKLGASAQQTASYTTVGGVQIKSGGGISIDTTTHEIYLTQQTTPGSTQIFNSNITAGSSTNGVDPTNDGNSNEYFATVGYVKEKLKISYATASEAGTIKVGDTLKINNGVLNITGFSKDPTANMVYVETDLMMESTNVLRTKNNYNGIPLSVIGDAANCDFENYYVTKGFLTQYLKGDPSSATAHLRFLGSNPGTMLVGGYLAADDDNRGGSIDNGIAVSLPEKRDRLFTTFNFTELNYARVINDSLTAPRNDFSNDNSNKQFLANKLSYGGSVTYDYDFDLIHKGYVDELLKPLTGTTGITSALAITQVGGTKEIKLNADSSLISGTPNNNIPADTTDSIYNSYFITKGYGDNSYVQYKNDKTFSNTSKAILNKIKYDPTVNIVLKADDQSNADMYTLVHRKYIDDLFENDKSPVSALSITGTGADKKLVIDASLESKDPYNGLPISSTFDPDDSTYDNVFLTKGAGDKLYAKVPTTLKRGWLYYNDVTKKTEWDVPWFDSFDDSIAGKLTVGPNTLSLIAGKKDNGIIDPSLPSFNNYFVTNELLRNNYVYKPDASAKNKYVVINNSGKVEWRNNIMPATLDSGLLISNGTDTSWSKTTTENKVLTSSFSLDLNKIVYTWQPGVGEYFTYDKNTSILLSRNALTVDLENPYNGIKTDVLAKPTEDKYTNHFITKAYIDNYGVQYIDGGTFNVYVNTSKTLRNKLQYGSTVTYDTSATDLDKYTLVHKKYVDDKVSSSTTSASAISTAIDEALDNYFTFNTTDNILSAKYIFSSKDATNGIDLTNESKGNNNFVTFNILKQKFLEIVGTDGTVNADSVLAQFKDIVTEVASNTTDITKFKTDYFNFDSTKTETTSKYKLKAKNNTNDIPTTGTIASTFDPYFTTKSYLDTRLSTYISSTDLETSIKNSQTITDLSTKVTNATNSSTTVTTLNSYFTYTKIGGTTTNPVYSLFSNFPLQTTLNSTKTDVKNGIKNNDVAYDGYFTTKKYCDDTYAKLPTYPTDKTKSYVLVLGTDQKLVWSPVISSTELPVANIEPGLYYIYTG